ncbi:hypothetical protein SU69_02040 [Thermosipho melanesiensis]|uniref:Lipoprotein n=2 Tax=Thermosipho melanesiensis TaxID=46541 RepID=A6LK08_THEM4|nr:hypothetical protein [Thermosipho melanesiensis]ABR30259.1 hypothetical protein Tmel_0390 [Thermosipho melanesiensis BI429]APT74809.1 hypothetical protein BW47_02125 [Thermosipho melanesiensis]OOC37390.1 hypothetical protein SU68_02050 [Thermosipho melanesiensis]OOC39752.1 hypothetical protein SU69_02040 [Thermosipho melanesiensis]OOC39857.1 hypothetical protein SU70_02035 [Thermosipho melanesiensis]
MSKKILMLLGFVILFIFGCIGETTTKEILSAAMYFTDVYIGNSKYLIGYTSIENLGLEKIDYFAFNFEVIFSNGATHTGLRKSSFPSSEIPILPGIKMPIQFRYNWLTDATVTEVRITNLLVRTSYTYYDYADETYRTRKLERIYNFNPPLSIKITEQQ